MEIKICGLTQPKEAEYLNKNKVDYAGMVLYFPKSKRNIDLVLAHNISEKLNKDIKKVAVVVEPTIDQVKAICEAEFDIVQIHGKISEDVYEAIDIDIWKAFNVKDMDDYESYKNKDKIKGFVFDSSVPGSGKLFDYKLLDSIERVKGKKIILAGGLRPSNVRNVIERIRPDVVDVSSGVEFVDKPGKEPAKIDEFVNNCSAFRMYKK